MIPMTESCIYTGPPWSDDDMRAFLRAHFGRPTTDRLPTRRPTIEELEAMLEDDEWTPIEILPNGEIRELGNSRPEERRGQKPLTMREDLGGEYAVAA